MLCLSLRPNTSREGKELAHVAGMCPLSQYLLHFHCHPARSPGITGQCEDRRGETELWHCHWYLCDFMQVTQPLWVWKWKSESHSVVSDSLRPRGLYTPWNSPGQNTGVGSRSLLQGVFPTQGLKSVALLKKRKWEEWKQWLSHCFIGLLWTRNPIIGLTTLCELDIFMCWVVVLMNSS